MLSAELMGLAGLTTWRLDRHGVTASSRLRELLGVTGDAVMDRESFRAFLHPDDYAAVRACNERLLTEGGTAQVDLRIRDAMAGARCARRCWPSGGRTAMGDLWPRPGPD